MNCVPFLCLALLVAISVLLTITNADDDHIHRHDHVQAGARVAVSSSTSATASSSLWVGKEGDNSNNNDNDSVPFQLEERLLQESALNEFVEVTSNVQEEVPEPVDSDSLSTNSTAEENEDHHDDHSEDCHCDGDIPHCATLAFETSFHCGEHHNEEEINCHCDGDIPHCSNPADAPSYNCHDDGQHEEHSDHGHDETGCHCDGDIPHCEDPAEETSYSCHDDQHEGHDDHGHDETGCHCDGDIPHCEDPAEETSYSCHEDHDDHDEHQNMDNGDKPWWEVVIFSLIINVSTLAGVVVVAAMWLVKKVSPNCQTNKATVRLWVEVLIPMFACGALLATTFFILLPESYVIVMSEFTGGDPHAGHNHRRFLSGDDEEEEPKGEAAGTWRWGSSIMGGFWIPVIMHACFPHDHNHGDNHDGHDNHGHGGDDNHGHNHDHDQKGTGSDDSTEKSPTTHGMHNSSKLDKSETTMATTAYRTSSLEDSTNDLLKESPLDSELETGGGDVLASASQKKASRASEIVTFIDRDDDDNDKYENENDADYIVLCGMLRLKNLPLFISMNIGEALHNFTDGVFVGTALLSCGRNMAISIALATILHELPNQLAGWFVMVNQNGINPWIALLLNFLFGLSILLGGLLVFLFDFSQVMIGCVLAIGGGTFIHVAIGELLQNAERNITHGIQMMYAFVAFLVGAVPIGLILINHEHC